MLIYKIKVVENDCSIIDCLILLVLKNLENDITYLKKIRFLFCRAIIL